MAKYTVTIRNMTPSVCDVPIEAETEEQAREKAAFIFVSDPTVLAWRDGDCDGIEYEVEEADEEPEHVDRTNEDRIADARKALIAHGQLDGCDIRDLIADLLHLAHSEGLDPDEEIQSARSHFHTEMGYYSSAERTLDENLANNVCPDAEVQA